MWCHIRFSFIWQNIIKTASVFALVVCLLEHEKFFSTCLWIRFRWSRIPRKYHRVHNILCDMPFMFAKAMFWQQQPTQKPLFAFFEVESKTKTVLWAFCIVLTRKCLLSIQILCKLINFAVSHSQALWAQLPRNGNWVFVWVFQFSYPTHRAVLRAEWLNGLQSGFGCDSAWKNSSVLPILPH